MTLRRSRTDDEAVRALVELGLSELEATVYCHLVDAGPSTGYQVSKELGKAVANTYKVLYSLEELGAVLVEEGEARRCRAVAPRELLARLEREFRGRREAASRAFARPRRAREDSAVYRLANGPQVMEHARAMLRRAKNHVVIDAFPGLLRELLEKIEQTAARGVRVLVLAYEPTEVAGTPAVLHPSRADFLAKWPGDRLSIQVDGSEYLHAILAGDGAEAVQAVCSASSLLACEAYVAAVNGVALSAVMDAVERGADSSELRRILASYEPFRLRHTRGFKRLVDPDPDSGT